MKLKMTLPDKPGFLHILPLLDLLALVLLFSMLKESLSPQAGVEVELPETNFRLQRISSPIVVSITGGIEPQFWVGREQVEREDLVLTVKKHAESWKEGGSPAVLLKVATTAQQHGTEVTYQLLSEGFRCVWGAKLSQD